MSQLPVYSSRDVQVSWGGIPLNGFAKDSFVTFQRNSDLTDEETGADGFTSISLNADRSGTCTMSFQQNSEANLILSGVINEQEQAGTAFKVASLTIADPSGSVIALLTNCHIKTSPEVTLSETATGATRDWVFYCQRQEFTPVPEGIGEIASVADRVAAGIETARGFLGQV